MAKRFNLHYRYIRRWPKSHILIQRRPLPTKKKGLEEREKEEGREIEFELYAREVSGALQLIDGAPRRSAAVARREFCIPSFRAWDHV